MKRRDQLLKLAGWLKAHHPKNVLIPMTDKRPIRSHRGGAWGWANFDKFMAELPVGGPNEDDLGGLDFGILLQTLAAVDFDDEKTALEFERRHPAMLSAPTEKTRKGRHVIFARPDYADAEGFYDGARQKPDLPVDFKSKCSTGTSGVLVVAPSLGKTWIRPPWECELQEIPRELLEEVCQQKTKGSFKGHSTKESMAEPQEAVHDLLDPARQVSREDPVVKLLHLLSKTRWDHRESWMKIALALKNEAGEKYRGVWVTLSRLSPKFDAREAARLWESLNTEEYQGAKLTLQTIKAWAREDDPIGFSAYRAATLPASVHQHWQRGDRGLAIIVSEKLKDTVKYSNKQFYYFDPQLQAWVKKESVGLHSILSFSVEESLVDLKTSFNGKKMEILAQKGQVHGIPDQERRYQQELDNIERKSTAIDRIISYICSTRGMANLVREASAYLRDDDFEQQLDSVPHLLGVKNGVIDLRTGKLRQRTPEDMIHQICPVEYDENASPDFFHGVVLAAMADDEEMARYLQRLLGYGITGEINQEVFPIFTGSGRNCKGVITQTLSHILGPFYCEMNVGLITNRHVANLDVERGKLLGARVALFNELAPGEHLKTVEVKSLTGGDDVTATPKYKNPVSMKPRHLCILSTNHMPQLTEVIPAIVERFICINFPVRFTDLPEGEAPSKFVRQRDASLKRKLRDNAPAVLKWFVDGAVAWYASEDLMHSAPAKVKEFSRKYFQDQDTVASFIGDRCRVDETLAVSSVLFLQEFNRENPKAMLSAKAMAKKMEEKGFQKKYKRLHGGAPVPCYFGLDFIDDVAADDIDG
jgi:P4 family phage/plasmid primase-like protien